MRTRSLEHFFVDGEVQVGFQSMSVFRDKGYLTQHVVTWHETEGKHTTAMQSILLLCRIPQQYNQLTKMEPLLINWCSRITSGKGGVFRTLDSTFQDMLTDSLQRELLSQQRFAIIRGHTKTDREWSFPAAPRLQYRLSFLKILWLFLQSHTHPPL